MQTLYLLLGYLVLLVIILLFLSFVYYYFYPERSVRNIIANADLQESLAAAGKDGFDGSNGSYGETAVNGLKGATGSKGADAADGRHSLVTGATGAGGATGATGPPGIPGIPGDQGLPSNAIIPRINYSTKDIGVYNPVVIEHEFRDGDVTRKLTGSFLFEDISYFSFPNGVNNIPFEIETTSGVPLFYHNLAPEPTFAAKVYGTLRVVVERKEKDSDGTVFYVSPPINRTSYLIKSERNYNELDSSNYKLEEIIINSHRDFGLNFKTTPMTGNKKYHFIVGGILRYRMVFNIEPPTNDLYARIEERVSSGPIVEWPIVRLNLPAKGNYIQNRTDDGSSVYLLSSRFPLGNVVLRDASSDKQIWTVQDVRTLQDSIDKNLPPLVQAFDLIESRQLSFKNELKRARTIKVFETYTRSPIIPNLLFRLKNSQSIAFTQPSDPNPGTGVAVPANSDIFSTKMTLNNFNIIYPNDLPPITFPSVLEGSRLYLKFVLKINVKRASNIIYNVWIDTIPDVNPVDESDVLLVSTVRKYPIEYPFGRDTNYEDDYIYHSVEINSTDNISFKELYGNRIVLKLSTVNLEFESRYGYPSNYYVEPLTTRLSGNNTQVAFEGSNTPYDFTAGSDDCIGFDYKFESDKFSVESNVFQLGYYAAGSTTPTPQVVTGYRQTNGDYFIDVPVVGY